MKIDSALTEQWDMHMVAVLAGYKKAFTSIGWVVSLRLGLEMSLSPCRGSISGTVGSFLSGQGVAG